MSSSHRLRLAGSALALALCGSPAPPQSDAAPARAEPDHGAGFATLDGDDLEAHLLWLGTAPLEGRDSPSVGLELAADYIAAHFAELGLVPPEGEEDFLLPFTHGADMPLCVPDPEGCELVLDGGEDSEPRVFEYGADFVPAPRCTGEAQGPLSFLGFGISSRKKGDKYDDLRGKTLAGRVAVILEGEPRHRSLFGGREEVTGYADLYSKLANLRREQVAGVVVVRRPPVGADEEPVDGAHVRDELSFRHTWSSWASMPREAPSVPMPVVEVSPAVAEVLIGRDVLALAERIDRSGKPIRIDLDGPSLRLKSASAQGTTQVDNVVGLLVGSDPVLADEVLILGAHYDHIGVDERGRIGCGADDNGSGTAALLELAEALRAAHPRRSILFCAFAAEEDGLVGSKALAADLPVPREQVVAMINIDMIGRGETKELAVLGVRQNPGFEKLLDRAKRLAKTRISRIVVRQGEELFERSDHYPFHERGLPVLFFFEGLPITKNPDYHTWRDTVDRLDLDKIENTSRLIYNTAWLLANDDERPPPPGR